MKKLTTILLLALCFLSHVTVIRADYVLPYPSAMPGNKVYKITRVLDRIKKYWYWGNIAQTKYHLELADKYLVEAKTLMEYNQFLLGSNAVTRSDKEFQAIVSNIGWAKKEHKDVSLLIKAVDGASAKHEEVLRVLIDTVPVQFTWTPEKDKPIQLSLRDMLQNSIHLRTKVAAEAHTL